MIAATASLFLIVSQQSVVLANGKKCSWKEDYRLYEKSDPVAGIEIIPGVISGTPKKAIEALRPELVAGPRAIMEVAPGLRVPVRAGFSRKKKLLAGIYFEGTDFRPVLAALVRKYGRPTLSQLTGVFKDIGVPLTGEIRAPKGEMFRWCTASVNVRLYDDGDKYEVSISVDYLPLRR